MSAQIIQSITLPPVKRQRTANTKGNMFKCGEVFVTNCADKWTFYCSHCQLATTDVGVFVCHIRLKHMNDEVTTTLAQETPRNSTPITIASSRQNVAVLTPAPPATSISIENVLPSEIAAITARDRDGLEQMHTEIVKEEPKVSINQSICSQVSKIVDISSLAQRESNNATPAVINEIPLLKNDALGDQPEYEQQQVTKETIEVVYMNDVEEDNDETQDTLSAEEVDDDDDNDNEDNDDINDPEFSACVNSESSEEQLTNLKCPYCSTVYGSRTNLLNHLKILHFENFMKKYPIQCHICTKVFKTRIGLTGHIRTHQKKNQIACPICPSVHYARFFANHVILHESETCFPCQVCGVIYDSSEKRLKHWQTHEKYIPYGCDVCLRRFRNETTFLRHLNTHNPLVCSVCKIEYTPDRLTHSRCPPHFCRDCLKKPSVRVRAKVRKRPGIFEENFDENDDSHIELIDDQNQPSSGVVYNNESKEIFTISEQKANDEFEHIEEVIVGDCIQPLNDTSEPIPCKLIKVCDSETINIDEDNVESNADIQFVNDPGSSSTQITKITFEECNICHRIFKSHRSLSYHMFHKHKRNASNYKFKCLPCKKSFKTRSGLVFHKRTHDSSNNLRCPVCPNAEFRVHTFLSHVMLHESDTCYPCEVCGQIFPTNAERRKHWETHAEEKPYPCNICHRRFRRTDILRNHMRLHGFYECKFCGTSFKSLENLHRPFICGKCEKVPNIKRTVEHQRALASNKRVFESDEEE